MTRIVETADAPRGNASGPFPFSQAVVAAGLVFVSGQGPFDPENGAIVGSTIQEQTRQAMRNVEAILVAAGSSLARVASVQFLLTNPEDFAGFNEEWSRWFPHDPPARSGARHPLANPGLRISIAVVAEVTNAGGDAPA
ncbi:MAG TPA: RidA family protein [Candidatus Limnocylindrales bacterium]|nr:RidA family protein [Candidatus Limnocylindrales bacterium]